MHRIFLFSLAFLPVFGMSQNLWTPAEHIPVQAPAPDQPLPRNFSAWDLNVPALSAILDQAPERSDRSAEPVALSMPDDDGSLRTFLVRATHVMHPDLGARYPEIRTYAGYDPEEPATWIHLDLTPKGFHAMITRPGSEPVFVDPADRMTGKGPYLRYARKDALSAGTEPFQCLTETEDNPIPDHIGRSILTGETLRTYRLAVACTGEYGTFHGGTIPGALSAIVATMNRVNGLYEREFGVWLELVPDNDQILYFNPTTDPYNNNSLSQMLGQNQTTLDNIIGSANYDMGHVFGTSGGGLATLRSPCNNNNKARAGTGLSNPVGDVFDVDYVSHEMGHQFGCDHTFNNSCSGNRNDATAWEPGSGNTIMGYTGICAPNIQDDSDPYFHGGSLVQARIFTTQLGGDDCPVKLETGNQLPTVDAGKNYIIPKATPFILTASGSDPDGDVLTYTWEQFDNGIADMPPSPVNNDGPTFKSVLPDTVPYRFFPALPVILNNGNSTWEVLPATGRLLNFRATVRDNHPGHGLFAQDAMIVTVDADAGPFEVTFPNTVFPTWRVGDTLTITWDVAGSDLPPVNCALVDVLLSLDGGYTWPVTLGHQVPNDGDLQIVVPLANSTKCRVKVQSVGNIFFDVSDVNFAIKEPIQPGILIQGSPDELRFCRSDLPDTLVLKVALQPLSGFSDTLDLSLLSSFYVLDDLPDHLVLSGPDTLTVRLWDLAFPQAGVFPLALTASHGSTSRTITFTFDIQDMIAGRPVLLLPEDNTDSIGLTPTLTWMSVQQADAYRVEVSLSPAFSPTTVVDSLVRDTFLHLHLADGLAHYWRVTPVNICGYGPVSAVSVFRTKFSGCQTYTPEILPVNIPDDDAFTYNSTVSIPDAGILTDVNVHVDLTHTYLNDVTLRLIHPGGTGLTLLSKVCDNGQNILATFDDDGEPFSCSGNPAVSGTVTPENGLLSGFNGLTINGTWTLRIVDSEPGDGGTMNLWQLELCRQVPTPPALSAQVNALAVPYLGQADLTPATLMVHGVAPDTGTILLTLRVIPDAGTLEYNNQVMIVGDVFPRSAIASGSLRYVHDGNGNLEDSFMVDALRLHDQGWLAGITVPVNIFADLQGTVTSTTTTQCPGDSTGTVTLSLSGGKSPAEYRLWPDGDWQSDSLFAGLPAGDHQFEIRDANGLTTIPLLATVSGPAAWTIQSEVRADTIRVMAGGATPPYTYTLKGQTNVTGEFIVPESGLYPVLITDSLGCTTAAVVDVLFLGLDLSVSSGIACFGDSTGEITLIPAGGNPPYEFRLNNGPWQGDPVFSQLSAGDYEATVRDDLSVEAMIGTIQLLQPDSLALLGSQVQDSTVNLSANGGTPPYLFQIGIGSLQEDPVFGGLPEGLYTCRVIDAHGCEAEAVVQVMIGAVQDPGSLKDLVSVRPNPSDGRFELVLPDWPEGMWTWQLWDVAGRPVRSGTARAGVQTVNCPECPSGLYILRLRTEDGQEVNLRMMIE